MVSHSTFKVYLDVGRGFYGPASVFNKEAEQLWIACAVTKYRGLAVDQLNHPIINDVYLSAFLFIVEGDYPEIFSGDVI